MDGLSSQDPLYCLTLWLCFCLYQPGAQLWAVVRAEVGWGAGRTGARTAGLAFQIPQDTP